MSEPYPISITKTGDAIVCSIDMWRDVQEKINRFFADRTKEEAVRQLREIGFERVVRCRDCKNFASDELGDCCTLLDFEDVKQMGNGFCAWGERRDA
jgi:hypothetical protein